MVKGRSYFFCLIAVTVLSLSSTFYASPAEAIQLKPLDIESKTQTLDDLTDVYSSPKLSDDKEKLQLVSSILEAIHLGEINWSPEEAQYYAQHEESILRSGDSRVDLLRADPKRKPALTEDVKTYEKLSYRLVAIVGALNEFREQMRRDEMDRIASDAANVSYSPLPRGRPSASEKLQAAVNELKSRRAAESANNRQVFSSQEATSYLPQPNISCNPYKVAAVCVGTAVIYGAYQLFYG